MRAHAADGPRAHAPCRGTPANASMSVSTGYGWTWTCASFAVSSVVEVNYGCQEEEEEEEGFGGGAFSGASEVAGAIAAAAQARREETSLPRYVPQRQPYSGVRHDHRPGRAAGQVRRAGLRGGLGDLHRHQPLSRRSAAASAPHPARPSATGRNSKAPVNINKIERAIGDFGIEKGLKLKILSDEKKPQKIAVVGGGPSGFSCAYQLARRGYGVTVFEALRQAGRNAPLGHPRLPAARIGARRRDPEDPRPGRGTQVRRQGRQGRQPRRTAAVVRRRLRRPRCPAGSLRWAWRARRPPTSSPASISSTASTTARSSTWARTWW